MCLWGRYGTEVSNIGSRRRWHDTASFTLHSPRGRMLVRPHSSSSQEDRDTGDVILTVTMKSKPGYQSARRRAAAWPWEEWTLFVSVTQREREHVMARGRLTPHPQSRSAPWPAGLLSPLDLQSISLNLCQIPCRWNNWGGGYAVWLSKLRRVELSSSCDSNTLGSISRLVEWHQSFLLPNWAFYFFTTKRGNVNGNISSTVHENGKRQKHECDKENRKHQAVFHMRFDGPCVLVPAQKAALVRALASFSCLSCIWLLVR